MARMDDLLEGRDLPDPRRRLVAAALTPIRTTTSVPGRAVERMTDENVEAPTGGGGSTAPPVAPWDDPNASQYAPRIITRGGQSYLTEHGNERLLQPGQEVADATRYRDQFWAQYPTGFQAGVGPQRNADYTAPTQARSGTASLGAGTTPFEGFDFSRAQDPTFSAKDSFAAAASAAGTPPPGLDKSALAGWFNQYIRPGMEANGHTINWVDGDKMNFTSPQGTFTVDWVRGAGANGFAFAWQIEGTPDLTKKTTPGATGTGTTGTGTTDETGNRGTTDPVSSPYEEQQDASTYEADPTLYDLTYARYYERQRNQ